MQLIFVLWTEILLVLDGILSTDWGYCAVSVCTRFPNYSVISGVSAL